MIVLVFAATCVIVAPAQNLTTLVTFDGTNGQYPEYMSLVQATDGNFYGTTAEGGDHLDGTVFKMTAEGSLSTIYSFCNQSQCADGGDPMGVIQGRDGDLYGTTYAGGNRSCPNNSGWCGIVFKLTTTSGFTVLYTFCSQQNCADGAAPLGVLAQGTDGNFYGTTSQGGANTSCGSGGASGCGTVFKITSDGKLTTLYSFCSQTNCTDGSGPEWGLIQAIDGNFYGTTSSTIFKISPAGQLTTLYTFCSQQNCTDGVGSGGALVQGSDGNFYGTTLEGGNVNCGYGGLGCGTIFKLTAKGTFTTLHSFDLTDGYIPSTTLVQGTDGDLYGTTWEGGANYNSLCKTSVENFGCGTLFKITTGGTLTTLYSFCSQTNCADGMAPLGGLLQATIGIFYGSTPLGGDLKCFREGCGTIFSEAVGLGPFVLTRPTSGKVGKEVIILGNNLTGTTSVAFHGTPAKFKVLSSSEITTNVPTGATTGKVKVTTPSGTLDSKGVFRVIK
jgi:uncharacterized repeat protein (TIGR03803 family)